MTHLKEKISRALAPILSLLVQEVQISDLRLNKPHLLDRLALRAELSGTFEYDTLEVLLYTFPVGTSPQPDRIVQDTIHETLTLGIDVMIPSVSRGCRMRRDGDSCTTRRNGDVRRYLTGWISAGPKNPDCGETFILLVQFRDLESATRVKDPSQAESISDDNILDHSKPSARWEEQVTEPLRELETRGAHCTGFEMQMKTFYESSPSLSSSL